MNRKPSLKKTPGKNKKGVQITLSTANLQRHFLFWGSIIAVQLLFGAILFYCYPFPGTYPDSGTYIEWAPSEWIGGYRPAGYSVFLNRLKMLSPFDKGNLLFFAQYAIHCLSGIVALYVLKKDSLLKRWFLVVISLLILFNPMSLFLTRFVMSDSLFHSMTILYVCSGLLYIRRASIIAGLSHVFLIAVLLYLRYTAFIYPLISVSALLLLSRNKLKGALAAFAIVLITAGILNQIASATKKNIGYRKISAFGEWQLANNALHIIPYIELEPQDITNEKARFVHSVVKELYPYNAELYPEKGKSTFVFMWDDHSPLKQAFERKKFELQGENFRTWTYMGDYFKEYGLFLISRFPGKFFLYYLVPSTRNFFIPENDLLEAYPDSTQPPQIVKEWFNLKDTLFLSKLDWVRKISPAFPYIQSLFVLLAGCVILLQAVWLFQRKALIDEVYKKSFLFLGSFIVAYAGFLIFASPPILRTAFVVIFPVTMLTANAISWYRNRDLNPLA